MATKLSKIVADFTTSLATSMAVSATSVTLQSATDDDGVALPAGTYFFAIDGNNSQKEHIVATLSGTSLTSISSVSRQGVQASGVVRSHRVGATVTLTDFAHIKYINDLLTGATDLDSTTPLKYDGVATISNSAHLATKKYVDDTAVSGAPNASTTVKGIVEEATQAETDARTTSGGTSAELYINPGTLRSTQLSDYVASDTGSANAYAIAPTPAITAYAAGQRFTFKVATANTTTSTLAVSGLAAKTIKKLDGATNLAANDFKVGQIVEVEYDGTNFQLLTPTSTLATLDTNSKIPVTNTYFDYQLFTSTGTWTKPTGLTGNEVVLVQAWGAGGGGGTTGTGGANGGGGGGGGAFLEHKFRASDLGATVTVTVGTGATATIGGNTTFGTLLTAYGGGAGQTQSGATNNSPGGGGGGVLGAGTSGNSDTTGGIGGLPGTNTTGVTNVGFGGAGGSTTGGASAVYGGGGGGGFDGAAHAGGASVYGGGGGAAGGGAAAGGTSVFAGAGGAAVANTNGTAGSTPGGGGAGGSWSSGGAKTGGAGGRGEVRVWVLN